MIQIINSTNEDIETIFGFYDDAVAFQKTVFNKHWLGFDLSLIETEINENRQYKIVEDGVVVCIFAITFDDALIWRDLATEPSLFIHRIVTGSKFRGGNYVKNIIDWAIHYCKENRKEFVRIDTWGDNQKLIDYYINCGFTFVGLSHMIFDDTMPKHYQGNRLSLFEIAVKDYGQPA